MTSQGDSKGDPQGSPELEAAGVIDSKFGAVTLLRLSGSANWPNDQAKPCLGFIKRLDDAALQISGWSCQGDALPARRAAIGCMLNRLILLTAGNEPKLAELFARAELKRGSCAATKPSATSADWVTGAENPRLRGASDRRTGQEPVQCAGFHATFSPSPHFAIIVMQCGPIDLVTADPRQLK